jgi:hypothetical protein
LLTLLSLAYVACRAAARLAHTCTAGVLRMQPTAA